MCKILGRKSGCGRFWGTKRGFLRGEEMMCARWDDLLKFTWFFFVSSKILMVPRFDIKILRFLALEDDQIFSACL